MSYPVFEPPRWIFSRSGKEVPLCPRCYEKGITKAMTKDKGVFVCKQVSGGLMPCGFKGMPENKLQGNLFSLLATPDTSGNASKKATPKQPKVKPIKVDTPQETWKPGEHWVSADDAAIALNYKNGDSARASLLSKSSPFYRVHGSKIKSKEWARRYDGVWYFHQDFLDAYQKHRQRRGNKPEKKSEIVRVETPRVEVVSDTKPSNVVNFDDYRQAFEMIATSEDRFPVDFDAAWQWIGYSTKASAKRKLESVFVEGKDYVFNNAVENSLTKGRPSEQIMLTIDCFKEFCMVAETEQGKQVRLYYLEVEKRYQQAIKRDFADHETMRALQSFLTNELSAQTVELKSIKQNTSPPIANIPYTHEYSGLAMSCERINSAVERVGLPSMFLSDGSPNWKVWDGSTKVESSKPVIYIVFTDLEHVGRLREIFSIGEGDEGTGRVSPSHERIKLLCKKGYYCRVLYQSIQNARFKTRQQRREDLEKPLQKALQTIWEHQWDEVDRKYFRDNGFEFGVA